MTVRKNKKTKDLSTKPNFTTDIKNNKETVWWSEGIRFECQGSGKCCTSHGEYGYVFLTLEDRKRFAKHFNLTTTEFTKKYCAKFNGVWHIKDEPNNPDCIFLNKKSCGVYEARPTQCRTWPFWPEVMSAKKWQKDVASYCPGVGKGPLHTKEEIQRALDSQIKSESELFDI